MAYSTVYGYSVHRDCVNFQNGLCTLSGVAVDPNGAACPRFAPRSTDVYPLSMQMRPPSSIARVRERELLTKQLEELETQLKGIRERLKKFR